MTAIYLLFLAAISIIAHCDGFILPKESNKNLVPADLLLDSITLVGDHVRGLDDLKRVERAEESVRVEIAPNMGLDGDYVRGMDELKRVERSPSNSTSNKSSLSDQSNSNKNSGHSESNSGKGGSKSDKSSSNQSSKSDSNNNAKSQDKNSKEKSADNSSNKSKGCDNDENDKLHELLMIPRRIKEVFQRVLKLFSNGDDDDGNNDGNIDLLQIPRFLNKLKGLFDG